MPKITNNRKGPVTLPSGHVIKPGGTLTVTPDVMMQSDNRHRLKALESSGAITVEKIANGSPVKSTTTPVTGTAAKG